MADNESEQKLNKAQKYKRVRQLKQILECGSTEEIRSLEGIALQYCFEPNRNIHITYGEKADEYWAEFSGTYSGYNCAKVYGFAHDFRTEEQKKGFRYHLNVYTRKSVHPFDVWIKNAGNGYELKFASGLGKYRVRERFYLSEREMDTLFAEVRPEELLDFHLMPDYNGTFGIRGEIYIDGRTNRFRYPVYIADRIGLYLPRAMVRLLNDKLSGICQSRIGTPTWDINSGGCFSWEPQGWSKTIEYIFLTQSDRPFTTGLFVGAVYADTDGNRYRIVGFERGTNAKVLIRPINRKDEKKPDRLHLIYDWGRYS